MVIRARAGVMIWLVLVCAVTGAGAQEGAKGIFATGEGPAFMAGVPSKESARAGQKARRAKSSQGTAAPVREPYAGIKYWIEKIAADGSRSEVTADHPFRSGDRIKLRVETNRDGYLYVVNIGSTGRYRMLFPASGASTTASKVQAGTVYDVPIGSPIRFDENPGEEHLMIALSPRPTLGQGVQAEAEGWGSQETMGEQVAQAANLRGAKDLVLEDDADTPQQRAYAVVPMASLGEEGILAVNLKLRHR